MFKELTDKHLAFLILQAHELHGPKHKLGYKGMFASCNTDYAELTRENETLKEKLVSITEENEMLEDQTKQYKIALEEILDDGGNTEHTAQICIKNLYGEGKGEQQ